MRIFPHLREFDLVLYEEAQRRQTLAANPEIYDATTAVNDPHVPALIGISMLMPRFRRLTWDDWRQPGAGAADGAVDQGVTRTVDPRSLDGPAPRRRCPRPYPHGVAR